MVNGCEYLMKGFHTSEQFTVSTSARFLKQKFLSPLVFGKIL